MDMNEVKLSIYWPTNDDARGILEAHQAALVVVAASGPIAGFGSNRFGRPNSYPPASSLHVPITGSRLAGNAAEIA
jgi:hypothetical protein